MDLEQLIQKINNSHRLGEVLETSDWKRAYRAAVMQLHPDRCVHPLAAAALVRLNELRTIQERGLQLKDDAGEIRVFDDRINFLGDPALLALSARNYERLACLGNPAAQHFQNYLPTAVVQHADQLVASLPGRAVPLSGRTFAAHHVCWILSRLLEFCAWLAQEGYVHGGLHPESVWVVPKTHGIVVASFYHLQRRGGLLTTIAGHYQHWYPAAVFVEKRATSGIDVALCKRLAAYLLGDPSGTGVRLKKTQPPELVDFLLTTHADAYVGYDAFRQILAQYYPTKYHPLTS
ncbi:MAG: hypothetical protein DA408_10205 [Bacteroidetes bacterium]|nr:MAG: hypothetical protein C7N36_22015 [Bacteroidota bacterium]PTM12542.1 MAG: hypothetical protein DA408_10205 [Bacteroidota bacterium]